MTTQWTNSTPRDQTTRPGYAFVRNNHDWNGVAISRLVFDSAKCCGPRSAPVERQLDGDQPEPEWVLQTTAKNCAKDLEVSCWIPYGRCTGSVPNAMHFFKLGINTISFVSLTSKFHIWKLGWKQYAYYNTNCSCYLKKQPQDLCVSVIFMHNAIYKCRFHVLNELHSKSYYYRLPCITSILYCQGIKLRCYCIYNYEGGRLSTTYREI